MVSITDLGLAYRKAKVDLYYSTNPSLFVIAEYEEHLLENLYSLQERINSNNEDWVTKPEFLGDWTLAPKSISRKDCENEAGLIFASPDDEWASTANAKGKPKAEFRLMARCSIDFHVLSALWMMKVGDAYDNKLGSNVYGSRLRRNRHENINDLALGSFKPYLRPFRDWRDGGIIAMRSALADKKNIVALTADVSSFYHELNPGFMRNETFLNLLELNSPNDPEQKEFQEKLNRLFITALESWAKQTPLKKGLPVGLPASAVVANMALYALDKFIAQQVVPLYYGRYVDDILLVMENTSDIKSTEQFWGWIFNRAQEPRLFKWENQDVPEEKCILFQPDYLQEDRIAFANSKNKLFILSGETGTALVNAISEQINQRASEWRSLPNLPVSPGTVATDLLKATNHAGEQADNLRKTDALTLHRAGFALNLRDYEAFERDLPPQAWQQHRHAFFKAVIDHLLTPVKFFELAQYLPRIIRMATACEDFEYLRKLISALDSLAQKVEANCDVEIKSLPPSDAPADTIQRWRDSLFAAVAESIVAAFPPRLGKEGATAWLEHMDSCWYTLNEKLWIAFTLKYPLIATVNELQKFQARLFSLDLAHIPLRFAGLPKEMVSQRGIPPRKKLTTTILAELTQVRGDTFAAIETLADWLGFRHGIPSGLAFATRPISLNELYLVAPKPFEPANCAALGDVINASRGFELTEHKMPHWDKHRVLRIPDGEPKNKQTIAVASWETSDESFIAAVMRQTDPDSRQRYRRLNHLINQLISKPDEAGYLILPELAIPPQWFMRIADKLKGRGISLIAGVEYLHYPRKRVRHQVWASLTHDGLGFPSLMLYRQDKQSPALHEEQELQRLNDITLWTPDPWKNAKPPILEHGDFRFAVMICSELTNIHYRAALRGKIDALFVPEWNRDTETFNSLVESSALDIHAYIIQCNNRRYGDSRIRAPYEDRWHRDVIRVKGGNHDYCITGEINIHALRQFQSSHRSPSKGFKPVPDGFNADMAFDRKVLPKGDAQ
jgi:hypothetical protein